MQSNTLTQSMCWNRMYKNISSCNNESPIKNHKPFLGSYSIVLGIKWAFMLLVELKFIVKIIRLPCLV